MADQKPGLFWHVHHEVLIEWCRDYQERADYIRTNKSSKEIHTRLRLMQPVKGTLPQAVIDAAQDCSKVWQDCNKAWQVRNEAFEAARRAQDMGWQVHDETTYKAARRAQDRAVQARAEAVRAFNTVMLALAPAEAAITKALHDNLSAIEALHKQECLDCPWNGKTIFPKS